MNNHARNCRVKVLLENRKQGKKEWLQKPSGAGVSPFVTLSGAMCPITMEQGSTIGTRPDHFPPQAQQKPGEEHQMHPAPEVIRRGYAASGKLKDKVALI